MAAKVPIRTVYTGGNATGLAEYQTGEFIDYSYGGTGLSALGTAGQVLKVNSGANAIEWGSIAGDIEGVTAGTGLSGGGTSGTVSVAIDSTVTTLTGTQTLTNKTLTSPVVTTPQINDTSADHQYVFAVSELAADRTVTLPLLTGNDEFTFNAHTQTLTNKTLTSPDINTPDIDGGTIDGATIATSDITVGSGKTLNVSAGTLTLANNQISGDAVEGGTIAATTITALTTAGITASADIDIGSFEMRAQTFESDVATGTAPLVVASTTKVTNLNADLLDGMTTIDEDNMASNSATSLPTQQSVKAYVDSQVTAQDLDVTSDSGTIDIDLDSETLTIAGGTGLDSSASSTTVTLAIDSTVTTLTGTQTLTNKTLTTPTITTPVVNAGLQLKNAATSAGFLEFFEDSDNGTNKVTLIGPASTADVTVTLPAAADTLVGKATTDTLTNKTIDLDANTLTGTLAEFNSALQSESFVSLTGTETLTNKTLTSPTINGGTFSGTFTGTMDITGTVLSGASRLVFEGATADAYETTLTFTDPTADRTITFPDLTGTVALQPFAISMAIALG